MQFLAEDDGIMERYGLAWWEYPTKWIAANLLGRIPRLKEIGYALGDEIDSPRYRGRELTLVGHSQGGLVIQSWFEHVLSRGEARKLKAVRQAIFFATPSLGSTAGFNLRRFLSKLFTNPQEVDPARPQSRRGRHACVRPGEDRRGDRRR